MREERADRLSPWRRARHLANSVNQPRRAGALLQAIADIYRQRGDLDEALAASKNPRLLDPGAESADMAQTMSRRRIQGRILGDDNGVSLGRQQEPSPSDRVPSPATSLAAIE
jgi:hypothetical protein